MCFPRFTLFVACLATSSLQASVLLYEGFQYNVGATLQSQPGWTGLGSGSPISIVAGNIAIDDVAAPSGNQGLLAFGSSGAIANFDLQTSDLWFSFAFKITDFGALDAAGAPIAGFWQSGGGTAATIWLRRNGGNIDIGAAVHSSGPVDYNTNVGNGWNVADGFFIIGQYDFNGGASNNDVVNVWINPLNGPPVAGYEAGPWGSAIQISSGVDRSFLDGFYISATGADVTMDEIRVGDSWAAVTPVSTAVPETGRTITLLGAVVFVLALKRGTRVHRRLA